jgi:site-specific DNA recombinase
MTESQGKTPQTINYCLYARKSSESDERQTMSIGSQIKEMEILAKRDELEVVNIYQESHSAKTSSARPVFNKLLADITQGKFNGILTWAPDRLSRNAGDLGMLVDLMDQGKLLKIKTFSQSFSNNPNEKFLLMILCSQAKLENDNRGLNVQRGIRAKCEMGWRPGVAPLGYFNRAFGGVKDVVVDPERGPIIKEMFERVAKNGDSGRTIKRWLDKVCFKSRQGKSVALSQVYLMLKNPFYTGRFKYPIKGGKWYQGKHKPLINQELFDRVQKQLITCPKSKWGGKTIIFKGLFKCGSCKGNIIGEERFRKRKNKEPRRHVYYHCARQLNSCNERYISEEKLIKQILRYINFMNITHPKFLRLTDRLKSSVDSYLKIREEVLYEQDINPNTTPLDVVNFVRHILYNGTLREKRDLVKALGKPMYIRNQHIASSSDGFNNASEPQG